MAERETIDTAVIMRHFESAPGCPLCSFEKEADAYAVDRLLDGGMMVWDIRRETDARGFCGRHFAEMLASRNRFSLAVMTGSHLREIANSLLDEPNAKRGKNSMGRAVAALSDDCFLCRQMKENMENFEAGTAAMWKSREDFRSLFARKGDLCLRHFGEQLLVCEKVLGAADYRRMAEAMFEKVRAQLDALAEETEFYCSRFDYRVTGAEKNFGKSADVLERVCGFLNKDVPGVKQPR